MVISDPRPWDQVLRAWMQRHQLTRAAAGAALGVSRRAIDTWLSGAPCPTQRSHRALMTLIDEGRAKIAGAA